MIGIHPKKIAQYVEFYKTMEMAEITLRLKDVELKAIKWYWYNLLSLKKLFKMPKLKIMNLSSSRFPQIK